MGYLIKFNPLNQEDRDVFEFLWEAWAFVKTKTRAEARTADAVELQLESISEAIATPDHIICPHGTKVIAPPNFEWWRVPTRRELVGNLRGYIFVEDAGFVLINSLLDGVQPPQPRRKTYTRLLDKFEDAEKHWHGSEVDLRAKLQHSTDQPTA
jgi:hypothetical protein